MALFSRKRVARELGVTPARVSQMQNESAILPPTRDDEDGSGWPQPYVMEIAAARDPLQRRTSRSLFGLLPATGPAERMSDVVHDNLFIQYFSRGEETIALVSHLVDQKPAIGNFKPDIGVVSRYIGKRDLAESVIQATSTLELDPFDIYWVAHSRIDDDSIHLRDGYGEFVLIQEGDAPATVAMSIITAETVSQKLGRKVPRIPDPISTLQTVERWRQNGRQLINAEGSPKAWNRALAAVHVASMSTAEDNTNVELICYYLTRNIRWDECGDIDDDPWAPLEDVEFVEWLALEQNVDPRNLRPTIQTFETEPGDTSVQARRRAARWLSRRLYEEYWRHGRQPDRSLAEACRVGIAAVSRPDLTFPPQDEWFEAQPFHEIRELTMRSHPLELEYYRSLRPWQGEKTPACRHLEAEYGGNGAAELMQDRGDTPVLVVHGEDWQGTPQTTLYVAAPVAPDIDGGDGRFWGIRGFTQIEILPDTQSGPFFLRQARELYAAPFGRRSGEDFTHGYNGSGPSCLTQALVGTVSWLFPAEFTDTDRDALRRLVISADQGGQLTIPREALPCTWDVSPAV